MPRPPQRRQKQSKSPQQQKEQTQPTPTQPTQQPTQETQKPQQQKKPQQKQKEKKAQPTQQTQTQTQQTQQTQKKPQQQSQQKQTNLKLQQKKQKQKQKQQQKVHQKIKQLQDPTTTTPEKEKSSENAEQVVSEESGRETVPMETGGDNQPKTEAKKGKLPTLTDEHILKAVQALKAFFSNKAKESKELIEGSEYVHLAVSLDRVPERKVKHPISVHLPHPYNGESTDICLIVKPATKELLKDKVLPNVKKIITIDALKKKHHSYESKRKLLTSYDLFLTEKYLYSQLLGVLGKEFLGAKKEAFPISVKQDTVAAEIAKARDSTLIHIPKGTTICVRVGRSNMKPEELVENVKIVVSSLFRRFQHGILHMGLKGPNTVLLPMYAKAIIN